MINRLLRLSNWQLFYLHLGLAFISQITILLFHSHNFLEKSTLEIVLVGTLFVFVGLSFLYLYFGWFWAIVYGLQEKLPRKLNAKLFKVCCWFVPIHLILFFSFVSFSSFFLRNGQIQQSFMGVFFISSIVIMGLHLLAILSLFYLLFFVSKTLKMIDLQKEVSFWECLGDMYLLCFFPIGIWVIQSKINRFNLKTS